MVHKKKLLLFSTGGTIDMQFNSLGGLVPSTGTASILEIRDQEKCHIELEKRVWGNLPSPHIHPTDILSISKEICEAFNSAEYIGAIISHGTDTMEETAFILSLLVPPKKPLVLTGAMRSSAEEASDGRLNLQNALLYCLSKDAHKYPCVLGMGGSFFSGLKARKKNSFAINAFDAPLSGSLAHCIGGNIFFTQAPRPYSPFSFTANMAGPVYIISASSSDALFIHTAISHKAKGIVIEGFGAGNVPQELVAGIDEALKRHIPVVLTSRCYEGGVYPHYAYTGGAKDLEARGVILAGELSSAKARLLLMLAQGSLKTSENWQRHLQSIKKLFLVYGQ